MSLATATAAPQIAADVRLTLLATSDLHAHLMPFNYYLDSEDDGVGLARIASLIADWRARSENCLLMDNGDTLQGSPFGDMAAERLIPEGRAHPMIAAMNALGYDAATLGNHDFDFGLPMLENALSRARYPIVLANAERADGSPFLPPWTVLDRRVTDVRGRSHRIGVGVLGVVPPQVTQWNRALLQNRLRVTDMVDAVRAAVPAMRAAGADVIVVLAHSGIGQAALYPGMENAAGCIAALDGVDAVVAGHTHSLFPAPEAATVDWLDRVSGTAHGKPLVQPGYWGSHLGVINLTIRRGENGPWRVADHTVSVAPIISQTAMGQRVAPTSKALADLAARDHADALHFIRRPIGQTAVPLHTFFSFVAPCAVTQVVADAQRAHVQCALSDRPDLAGLPLISAAAPFKCGGRGGAQNYTDIPVGPLAVKHAANLYMYPNSLAVIRLTGAQVAQWLERVASAFHQITPGSDDQQLIDPAFAGYNFDVLSGLRYCIDVSQPRRFSADGEDIFDTPGRIVSLSHANGRPVDPDEHMLLVTNSYRAGGGGHFSVAAEAETVLQDSTALREILTRYIAGRDRLAMKPEGVWRFHHIGATVLVDTGPGALAKTDEIRALGLRDHGDRPAGFARFSMSI